MAKVTPDALAATLMLGAWLSATTNTYALFRDRQAIGVRPYSNMYLAISNSALAYQLASLGQPLASAVSVLFVLLNILNATLIVRYAAWQR